MKTFSLCIIIVILPFILPAQSDYSRTNINLRNIERNRTKELPFLEDWSSGYFETNNWAISSNNWIINNETGNEAPSAEFRHIPMAGQGFSGEMESDFFNAENSIVGKIKLQFETQVDNKSASESEFLYVDVFDGENWKQLAKILNYEIPDWKQFTFDITDIAIGHNFKIRFKVQVTDLSDSLSWFIDNISVYRVCDFPTDLETSLYWESNNNKGVKLNWKSPKAAIDEWYNWLSYDKDNIDTALGLFTGGDFTAAIRWDNYQLADYEGDTLRAIKFYISDSGFSKVIAKIWCGENAENLIYSDTLGNVSYHSWNEIIIDTLLIMEPSLEYWVGYRILGQQAGENPAGCTDDYGIPGYSDQVSFDEGEDIWDDISDLCCLYSWNIQLKLIDNDTNRTCLGYNILRKSNPESEYSLIDFVNNNEFMETCDYLDSSLNYRQEVCYKVSALWVKDNDSCVSPFAPNTVDGEDYSCVLFSSAFETDKPETTNIFPNPANNKLFISGSDLPLKINIYKLNGQLVISKNISSKEIDLTNLNRGMFIVELLFVGKPTERQKLIVSK
ncbi:MAG: T9SS type A sorting domain-containing protein [Chlorobi bacterium]|nr:T9SS type A sorting domain-containing protein [Chlorobiota bacterium]